MALLIRARLAVQGHEGTEVELGLLEELDLADVDLFAVALATVQKKPASSRRHRRRCPGAAGDRRFQHHTYVLEGVDALGGLLDLAADHLGDELGGELSKGAARGLALDDLGHLPADRTDL